MSELFLKLIYHGDGTGVHLLLLKFSMAGALPRNIVDDGSRTEAEDATSRASVRAERARLHRQADGHGAFDGHAEGQVRAARLRNQPDGVHEGGDVWKDLPVVEAEVGLGVVEDGGQAEHQDAERGIARLTSTTTVVTIVTRLVDFLKFWVETFCCKSSPNVW